MKNLPNIFKPKDSPSTELLVRYVKHELTGQERDDVQHRLDQSQEWRAALNRTQTWLNGLQSIPKQEPPDRVWHSINAAIRKENQTTVWFPWFHKHPAWSTAFNAMAACFIVMFTVIYLWSSNIGPAYQVIVVKDSNSFSEEAGTYLAHHELCGEPAIARDSLIAYYTYDITNE